MKEIPASWCPGWSSQSYPHKSEGLSPSVWKGLKEIFKTTYECRQGVMVHDNWIIVLKLNFPFKTWVAFPTGVRHCVWSHQLILYKVKKTSFILDTGIVNDKRAMWLNSKWGSCFPGPLSLVITQEVDRERDICGSRAWRAHRQGCTVAAQGSAEPSTKQDGPDVGFCSTRKVILNFSA